MTLWKFYCEENTHPGMWQRWFLHQCVGVGWKSSWGFSLDGDSDSQGWSRVRNALKRIKVGDHIVVALKDHRVGRLGEVTGKAIEDSDWEPLVPVNLSLPELREGEIGRRVFVRWDLTCGPDTRDQVVELPKDMRFTMGELRPTIAEIRSKSLDQIKSVMSDPQNWVELCASFDYEKSLSGYIAAYPHRLEDGFLQHPSEKVRERVFGDQTRSDVILIDRNERPVIVECKQGQPAMGHLEQLRGYMAKLEKETGEKPRGILIHGGSRKLVPEIATEAAKDPKVELVHYDVNVTFGACA